MARLLSPPWAESAAGAAQSLSCAYPLLLLPVDCSVQEPRLAAMGPAKQPGLTSFFVAECKFPPPPQVRHWIVGRSVAIMAGGRRGATDVLRTEVHRSENTPDVATRHDHLHRCSPGGSADRQPPLYRAGSTL